MKDDEYFGFSTIGDYKVVDLPDDDTEDDFKVVNLLEFDTEDDVRIVNLSDVRSFRKVEGEEDRLCNGITPTLQSFSALKSRRSRRQHVVLSAVVSVLVVTVLLVFLSSFSWVRSIGRADEVGAQGSTASASEPAQPAPVLAAPISSAPLVIDVSHYYIETIPAWAQILLDGHSLLHIPVPGVDLPLWISAGRHLVMWRLNNNHVYSCTMTVPPSLSDTCAYDGPASLQNGVAVWIITLPHFNNSLP